MDGISRHPSAVGGEAGSLPQQIHPALSGLHPQSIASASMPALFAESIVCIGCGYRWEGVDGRVYICVCEKAHMYNEIEMTAYYSYRVYICYSPIVNR